MNYRLKGPGVGRLGAYMKRRIVLCGKLGPLVTFVYVGFRNSAGAPWLT